MFRSQPQDECDFEPGSSCYVFCGKNFRMENPDGQAFPQVDWDSNLTNITAFIPDWHSYGDVVPYAVAFCPADNTEAALPLWSPGPRCIIDCPYPTYIPPGYRERMRYNRWRCEEGYELL
eukprot:g8889.t1